MSNERIKSTLSGVMHDLFEQMLDLPLAEQPAEAAPRPEALPSGAVVHILGDWLGSVVIQCRSSLAERMAGRMFATERPSTEEVDDTLREIANIIGGNLKDLLGRRCVLSTPKTKEQVGSPTGIQEGVLAEAILYASAAEPLLVTIYRSQLEL